MPWVAAAYEPALWRPTSEAPGRPSAGYCFEKHGHSKRQNMSYLGESLDTETA